MASDCPEHPGEINNTFRTTYRAQYKKKEPPQFSAQAFAAVQCM